MIVYFVITTICGFDNKGTYAVFVTEGDRSDTTNFVKFFNATPSDAPNPRD